MYFSPFAWRFDGRPSVCCIECLLWDVPPTHVIAGPTACILCRFLCYLTTSYHVHAFAKSNGEMIMEDKFERMWKETVLTRLKAQTRNLLRKTEENFVSIAGLRAEIRTREGMLTICLRYLVVRF